MALYFLNYHFFHIVCTVEPVYLHGACGSNNRAILQFVVFNATPNSDRRNGALVS